MRYRALAGAAVFAFAASPIILALAAGVDYNTWAPGLTKVTPTATDSWAITQTDGSIKKYGGDAYQRPITLTTTGTSGAATLTSNTLNIPQYSGGVGSGAVSSGTANQVAYYAATGTTVSGDSHLTDNGSILTATQAFALSGTLTPTALSGNVNDYSPTGLATATTLRLDGGAADRTITGLAGGVDGRIVTVSNIGSSNKLVLSNADSGSSAANRFQLSGNVELPPNTALALRYDGTSNLWRPWSRALANTVSAGSCTNCNATFGADGRATSYSSGSASGSGRIQFNSGGTGSLNSSTTFLGPAGVNSLFNTVRPFVAEATITVNSLQCWTNGGPGAGNVLNIDLILGAGGSTTGVSQSASQRVQVSGTTNLSSTVNNTDVTLSRGDIIALQASLASGSWPASIGLSCTLSAH